MTIQLSRKIRPVGTGFSFAATLALSIVNPCAAAVDASPTAAAYQPAHQTLAAMSDKAADSQPTYRKMRPPAYPKGASDAKVGGTVFVDAKIGADGSVTSATALETAPSVDKALAEAAVTAVKSWTFNPGSKHGKSAASEAVVPVDFKASAGASNEQKMPQVPAGTAQLDAITVTAS